MPLARTSFSGRPAPPLAEPQGAANPHLPKLPQDFLNLPDGPRIWPPTPGPSLQALTSYDPSKQLRDLLSAPTRTNSAHTHPAPLPGLLLSRPQACNLTHPPPPAPGHYLRVGPSPPPPPPGRFPSAAPLSPPPPLGRSQTRLLPPAPPHPGLPGRLLTFPPPALQLPGPPAPAPAQPRARQSPRMRVGEVWARSRHPRAPRRGPGLDTQGRS